MGDLVLKNDIKIYQFDESSIKYKIMDNATVFITLPIIPMFLYYVVYLLISKLAGDNVIPSSLHIVFLVSSFILGIVWLIKYKTTLKGVFLYDDYLQIERHFPSKYYLFVLNPIIKYNDIKNCEIRPTKPRNKEEWNEIRLYFMSGSSTEYIRIETKNDKIYLFSVENYIECFNEICKRIQ